MNIQHDINTKGGRFFITENGKTLAKMSYVWADEKHFIIDHTEVDPSLEGKGVGKELVAAGVAFARTQHVTILPRCPYAKAVMTRTTAYADVLFKS